MAMLVTLDEASSYVRRDTSDDDAELELLVQAASEAVLNYIKENTVVSFIDSNGDVIAEDSDGVAEDVPAVVKAATLYMTAWLYRHRDADPDKDFTHGYLPMPVISLLYPLRDPALA